MLSKKSNLNFQSFILLFALIAISYISVNAQGFEGYYRYPAIHGETIVFTAEGDLWKVSSQGGLAQRITTHLEEERYAQISPDGQSIAYTASYEGPSEIYTIPMDGGVPKRWTYERDFSMATGWTPDGKIIYDTRAYSTLPYRQLVHVDTQSKSKIVVPLSEASEGAYDDAGNALYFVRPAFHGNVTKRYEGGTARQIWRYENGKKEATKLTTDHNGESHHPMWFDGRVYFITDRDGTMNVWSMNEEGSDKKQHTTHEGFDVRSASLSSKKGDGQIVYQVGADIWHYNISSDNAQKVNIRILSDLDQLREKWVDNPTNYITSIHPDKSGEKVVITSRGRAFISPTKGGRMVSFTDKKNVRFRDAVFSADGKSIYTLSDESGEFEFISLPSNGIGNEKELTKNGEILRYEGVPSPDGKWLAYDDLSNDLYIMNIETGAEEKISQNDEGIAGFRWSPDSKWLSYGQRTLNTMSQIFLYSMDQKKSIPITTDRANSYAAEWSPDGQFIYFLSDRNFNTLVGSPWGQRQPEPYFDAQEKVYHIALQKGTRSPFRPKDELYEAEKENKKTDKKVEDNSDDDSDEMKVQIDFENIASRIKEVPVKAGNYRGLAVNKDAIYLLSNTIGDGAKTHLMVIKINAEKPELKTMIEDVRNFELTADGKKMLVEKGRRNYHMVNAGTGKVSNLGESKINLSGWQFLIDPKEDWKQLFTDAWRMERDYFYDKNMHGVDWDAMHDKYFPLVDRVTTRTELSDLIGRYVGELSALHTSVRGGDTRNDDENIDVGSLGARFLRNDTKGGYVIEKIYRADPDYPHEKSPLDDAYLDINEGDVITSINGKPTLTSVDIGEMIRNEVGKQVRMEVSQNGIKKDVIVRPIRSDYLLRYRDWEYSRRLIVDEQSDNEIGYVHLQAMGRNDLNQWYREFYPVFNRKGLIVDVRHNRGGNIESFILEKLMRRAWMFWGNRSGEPTWNMQYAFRGHIVVLVDAQTASDGEAFADGFKRLDLGTTIGIRTWGGEIWLGSQNRMTDGGLARAPMNGVYGPEGEWLIEGHGFEPDMEVDNLPHATYNGQDAQLDAAIQFLQKKIKEDPREVPPIPAFPDKSFKNN